MKRIRRYWPLTPEAAEEYKKVREQVAAELPELILRHHKRMYNIPMSTITVQDLERDPGGVLHRVEAGESIIVLRDDQPVAEVRPAASKVSEPRPFALAAGQFTVPADFDNPLSDDILKAFVGQ